MEKPFPEEQDEEKPRGGRVIVHLDLDCFYAQVEMLRDPELRSKPLGIQQKSIVTTCNYEARKFGIGKLMPVREAKEKCPQLILVNGEDLTPYREMSYKVTELLGEFCPLVERLGLDENFLDVTELVGKRFRESERSGNTQIPIPGHVYNQQAVNWEDPAHVRLILGSQLAREFREALKSRLGLTGCAGVASNKFLAKLVSGTFKPDQQTLLLPENHWDLVSALDHVRKIPGIGSQTGRRLEALGVREIRQLRAFPVSLLEKEFGAAAARRIWGWSRGEDDSPVIPWGPPQSFSDEDSFPKCCSEAEVREKIWELLPKLLDRISKDGRRPRTVRLSIRRFSSPGKYSNRECRQCPIPPRLLPKFGKAEIRDLIPPLVEILLRLFGKMVDVASPFHLTLLSVCFSNLQEFPGKKGSISFYLKPEAGKRGREGEGSSSRESAGCGAAEKREQWENAGGKAGIAEREVDPEGKRAGFVLPPDVDPEVFSQLPVELREELAAEWKNREAGGKILAGKASGKAGSAKGRRNPGASSQSNDLLRYWKAR